MTMYALIDSDAEAALIAAAQRGGNVRVLPPISQDKCNVCYIIF
jgi:hypothetical protein